MNLGCASARFSSPAPCRRLRRPGGHSCSGRCPPTPPATTLIISRQLIPSEPRHRQAELPGEGQPTAPQHWVTRGAGRGFRSRNHLAVPCSAPPAPHAAPSRPLQGRTRPRWPAGDRALPSLSSADFYTTWHPPKAFCRLAAEQRWDVTPERPRFAPRSPKAASLPSPARLLIYTPTAPAHTLHHTSVPHSPQNAQAPRHPWPGGSPLSPGTPMGIARQEPWPPTPPGQGWGYDTGFSWCL